MYPSRSLAHPPPNPSIVFVHSSDMNPALSPTIVCEAGDALLPSVNVRSEPYCRDYFVYRMPTRRRLPVGSLIVYWA
jgi:hypothetical protein